jgi:hypothetical protein
MNPIKVTVHLLLTLHFSGCLTRAETAEYDISYTPDCIPLPGQEIASALLKRLTVEMPSSPDEPINEAYNLIGRYYAPAYHSHSCC